MKNIYFVIYFIFLLLNPLSGAFSQNPLIKQWDKRYGGTNSDLLSSFQQTADGGYILGGSSGSGIGGDKTQASQGKADYWIVKTDPLGNKQWDKRFGGTNDDWPLSAISQTTDGGYILGGNSSSGIGGDKTQSKKGLWIIKIDSLGIMQWDNAFSGNGSDNLSSLQQTADGGYILGGFSNSGISGDKTEANWDISGTTYDYWIIKTDSLGIKQWDKRYGGTSSDQLYSLQQTIDGGYILGGFSTSGIDGDKTQGSQGGMDYWIVKTDPLGNKQWDKRFGGTGSDWLFSLQQTTDRGYILAGLSDSPISGDKTQASWGFQDYWIVKTDSLGNKQWDKDFGGIAREDEFGNVFQTMDGGYLVAGTSYSPISGDKTENNLSAEQIWIVKTDSSGKKQWDKTVFTAGHEEIGYAIQAKDGCYLFANYTHAGIGGYKTEANYGVENYWLVKFCDTTNASVILPKSNFLSTDTVICTNDCASFTNLSSNATSYNWIFAGATPSSSTDKNPQNICYLIPGTYDVKLIVSNGGGTDSVIFSNYIRVKPTPPTPVITQHHDTLYCNFDSSYTYYQWSADSVLIPGATYTYLVIDSSGNYNVQVTNENGCKIAVGINVVLGIHNYANDNSISLFPNPVANELNIHSSSLSIKKDITISIMNILGDVLLKGNQEWTADININVKILPAGIYFIALNDGQQQYVRKIVIQKL